MFRDSDFFVHDNELDKLVEDMNLLFDGKDLHTIVQACVWFLSTCGMKYKECGKIKIFEIFLQNCIDVMSEEINNLPSKEDKQ